MILLATLSARHTGADLDLGGGGGPGILKSFNLIIILLNGNEHTCMTFCDNQPVKAIL